jgi:hypothetical protein
VKASVPPVEFLNCPTATQLPAEGQEIELNVADGLVSWTLAPNVAGIAVETFRVDAPIETCTNSAVLAGLINSPDKVKERVVISTVSRRMRYPSNSEAPESPQSEKACFKKNTI